MMSTTMKAMTMKEGLDKGGGVRYLRYMNILGWLRERVLDECITYTEKKNSNEDIR